MKDIKPPPHVAPFYPDAMPSSYYIELFLGFAESHHSAQEHEIAFLTSICSDDLNSVGWPDTEMIGPFNQGGLDGYPFGGITGLKAFSHHIPVEGVALMFFGPHVGITDQGAVGMVIRPGQKKESSCCGAAALALEALEKKKILPLKPEQYPVDDYQQERIRQTVLENATEIEKAGDPGSAERFIAMSEAIYRKTHETFIAQVERTEFPRPAYYFGGILINQDGLKESLISIRHVAEVVAGVYRDLTAEFRGFCGRKIEADRRGDEPAVL